MIRQSDRNRQIDSGEFDIVAIGSGHNGLVAAAYLAKSGKRVLVLERNAWFGGGVVSRTNLRHFSAMRVNSNAYSSAWSLSSDCVGD